MTPVGVVKNIVRQHTMLIQYKSSQVSGELSNLWCTAAARVVKRNTVLNRCLAISNPIGTKVSCITTKRATQTSQKGAIHRAKQHEAKDLIETRSKATVH